MCKKRCIKKPCTGMQITHSTQHTAHNLLLKGKPFVLFNQFKIRSFFISIILYCKQNVNTYKYVSTYIYWMIMVKRKYAFIRVKKSTKDKLKTWSEICGKTMIDILDEIVNAHRDYIIISNTNRLFNSPNFAETLEIAKAVVDSEMKSNE